MDELALSTALASAGLEYLGPADPALPLIPAALAGFIVNCDNQDVLFAGGADLDDPQLVAALNGEWQRAVVVAGLAPDEPFLLGVDVTPPAGGRTRHGWARVIRTERWDPAGSDSRVLGHGPGRPSFVMLTENGKVIIRMSYGEVSAECTAVRNPERVRTLRDHAARMLGWDHLDRQTRSTVERWLAAHPATAAGDGCWRG